jgi:hypothetical protein
MAGMPRGAVVCRFAFVVIPPFFLPFLASTGNPSLCPESYSYFQRETSTHPRAHPSLNQSSATPNFPHGCGAGSLGVASGGLVHFEPCRFRAGFHFPGATLPCRSPCSLLQLTNARRSFDGTSGHERGGWKGDGGPCREQARRERWRKGGRKGRKKGRRTGGVEDDVRLRGRLGKTRRKEPHAALRAKREAPGCWDRFFFSVALCEVSAVGVSESGKVQPRV